MRSTFEYHQNNPVSLILQAKHIVNRAIHKLPYLDDALGGTNSSGSPSSQATPAMGTPHSSPSTQQDKQSTQTSTTSPGPTAQGSSTQCGGTPSHLTRSPQHASMVAIREAMDSKDFRCHGSPVMALKETIDNHFLSQRQHHALSARGAGTANAGGAGNSTSSRYSAPVMSPTLSPASPGPRSAPPTSRLTDTTDGAPTEVSIGR